MAPPRQRTTAVHDDSRSEASSTAREHKTASKGRKTANAPAAGVSRAEAKAAANVTSAPAVEDNLPKIDWNEMPLSMLHSYRHSYKLSCPSAYPSEYSQLLLSKGIGLRSPTAIAAQRAHQAKQDPQTNGVNGADNAGVAPKNAPNGIASSRDPTHGQRTVDGKSALHRIIAQDRVSKKQLATAARKHFNNAALAEQEAIARFLYKVREEGRGRQFRLRFQP
ncbi:hypothetical protein P168DRAFT_329380 [Aspergillus campestris IBT 28561]|uniref:Histone deacetylase complex subunit SAP30 Sin3 binding domain-containing protein n=1 Tax=Aspergillus campestris (strain IBT 28561) TaxID=1392248 RepID=A0A2I1CUY1_ASPC2|nr:uncharacterized protein P168DRAFT_329380 [Aspergillus campestris IBT 28561]PKY01414.1 hypothetical protein P168DRAFT_329380 [Aspergillus campestris IBT 28561]